MATVHASKAAVVNQSRLSLLLFLAHTADSIVVPFSSDFAGGWSTAKCQSYFPKAKEWLSQVYMSAWTARQLDAGTVSVASILVQSANYHQL
jgi:hypothetical protein